MVRFSQLFAGPLGFPNVLKPLCPPDLPVPIGLLTFFGLFSQLCLLKSPEVTIKLACWTSCIKFFLQTPVSSTEAAVYWSLHISHWTSDCSPEEEGVQMACAPRKTLKVEMAVEGSSAESFCDALFSRQSSRSSCRGSSHWLRAWKSAQSARKIIQQLCSTNHALGTVLNDALR